MARDRQYRKESRLHPDLYVGSSEIDGKGVFSRSALEPGDVVVEWGGKVFTRKDIETGRVKDHTMVAVEDGVFLGSSPDADYTADDFMNHSCSPNVGMRDGVTVIARCHIKAGTELTADYATWLDNPAYVMKRRCNCQTDGCRDVITGRDWMISSVQSENRGYFSPFLRRRIAQMNLSGDKVMDILITGGSRGIGKAIAEELVSAGHRVLITSRDRKRLESTHAQLAHGARIPPLCCPGDVSRAKSRQRLVEYCRAASFQTEVLA